MPSFSSDDLERLFSRCRNGDSEAWQGLVERFKSLVYSIPRRYGLNAEDCADVFQTTFQRLYQNMDRIDSAHGIPRWLAQTASREALQRKRTQKYTTDESISDLEELLASDDRTAEAEMMAAEESEVLRRSVGRLPSRCRDLITMLYLDGDIPYLEVAERMKMPVGSIGPTRARCLEKLRRMLAVDGFFD